MLNKILVQIYRYVESFPFEKYNYKINEITDQSNTLLNPTIISDYLFYIYLDVLNVALMTCNTFIKFLKKLTCTFDMETWIYDRLYRDNL